MLQLGCSDSRILVKTVCKFQDTWRKHTKVLWIFVQKWSIFRKRTMKIGKSIMAHSAVWRGKNGVYKIMIRCRQSFVKVIVVAFYKSAPKSVHGDTKHVTSESTETIGAKTLLETE